MHRRDKRKTAQPTPLSIISRHPAVPPLLRCTRLPAVPSPFGRARNPAVPPLFERNPIVPLCRPVQKQPAALQYRPVGRQLAALTCRPCTDTSSSPYYIVSVRISSTAPPHRSQTTPVPPIPLFGYSPVPPPAVQLHSDAHPTVPLCCCSQAAPVALHTETALLCRPCSNIPRCSSMPHGSRATPLPLPRLGTTPFSTLYDPLRMRLTAPLCHRCAEIRLLPDHILCSKAIPLPAVHPWPEISPAAPLCPTYFPSQTTRTGRFSFSVRPVFLWKFIGTALSFFRMDNDSQAAG